MLANATGRDPFPARLRDASAKLLHAAAVAVVILAVVYLILAIGAYRQQLAHFDWSGVRVDLIAACAAAYGASLLTTALAWPAILASLGQPLGLRRAVAIGLTAQAGKYVPGNVAHYLGRATLAKRARISFRNSGASTIVEFTSAVLAAGIIATISLVASDAGVNFTFTELAAAGAAIVALVGAAFLAVGWLTGKRLSLSVWIRPVAWLSVSFLFAGWSMHVLLIGLGAVGDISPLIPIGLYALAWTAGFILPGAPAGLGVREALLVALLGATFGGAVAIIATAVHRLVTAVTDGVVAVIGFGLLSYLREDENR